jgi:hypothetical protein
MQKISVVWLENLLHIPAGYQPGYVANYPAGEGKIIKKSKTGFCIEPWFSKFSKFQKPHL